MELVIDIMPGCDIIKGSETQNRINGAVTAGFLFPLVNNLCFGVYAPTLFGRAAVLRLTNQNGPASLNEVGALPFIKHTSRQGAVNTKPALTPTERTGLSMNANSGFYNTALGRSNLPGI